MFRFTGVGLWLSTGTLVLAIGALLCLPLPSVGQRWRRLMFPILSGGTAALLGMRVRTVGSFPVAPFLLVANHLSYLDIIAFSAVMPVRFVAKREVRGWPLIGVLSQLVGTIFIHREQKRDALRVIDQLGTALTQGDGALIFPESTSSDGAGILPFRPALLDWAAKRTFPVHAASVTYHVAAGEPAVEHHVCWVGDAPFMPHFFNLMRIPRVDAVLHFSPEPIADPDRKRLAERLHAAVSSTFTPTCTRAPSTTAESR